MTDWATDLEATAPNVIAAWRGIEAGRSISVRREVRRRAGAASTTAIVAQLAATAAALTATVQALPDEAFGLAGGESDWTVTEAIGHDAAARVGLVMAAGLAASGRWPADAPTVVPGVPGPSTANRDELARKLDQSQRIVARFAALVVGHEEEACPLNHPLVGRLRCGEWLLFAGVHDVMHLEQLHEIEDRLMAGVAAPGPRPSG